MCLNMVGGGMQMSTVSIKEITVCRRGTFCQYPCVLGEAANPMLGLSQENRAAESSSEDFFTVELRRVTVTFPQRLD